jgi:hypothetical protein
VNPKKILQIVIHHRQGQKQIADILGWFVIGQENYWIKRLKMGQFLKPRETIFIRFFICFHERHLTIELSRAGTPQRGVEASAGATG